MKFVMKEIRHLRHSNIALSLIAVILCCCVQIDEPDTRAQDCWKAFIASLKFLTGLPDLIFGHFI
jgi:hypothetical protein